MMAAEEAVGALPLRAAPERRYRGRSREKKRRRSHGARDARASELGGRQVRELEINRRARRWEREGGEDRDDARDPEVGASPPRGMKCGEGLTFRVLWVRT